MYVDSIATATKVTRLPVIPYSKLKRPGSHPPCEFLESSSLSSGSSLTVKSVLHVSFNSRFKGCFGGQTHKNQLFNSSSGNEDPLLPTCSKSSLKEVFSQSPINTENNQAFDRMSDGEAGAPKHMEVLDQQGWNEALTHLENQFEQGTSVSAGRLAYLLQHCNDTEGVVRCHQMQKYIILTGHGSNVFLHNNLVEMYSKCGSLIASRSVFSSMINRNVFSWTAIILAHVKHNQAKTALLLFGEMLETGGVPDKVLLVVILKACSELISPERGWKVHAFAVEYGYESDSHVSSSLIFMHAELGSLQYAQTVFDKIREPSVVAWNTLIMGYAEDGSSREAFALFRTMQKVTSPDDVTFLSVLKACINSEDLHDGMYVHAQAIANGLDLHLFVGSSLVDMYSKCGSVEHAYAFFNKLEARNVVSWTAIITAFAQQGTWDLTLDLFEQMQSKGVAQPNELTYASSLRACSGLCLEQKGRVMHAEIVKCGYELDVFIGSTLIDMYANCGFLDDASYVFSNIPAPNVVAFNAMISGYAQQGVGEKALELFEEMERTGLRPDVATFVSVLKTCSFMEALEQGKLMHLQIVKDGIELDAVVARSLVVLYSRCGSMEDAQVVFTNITQRDTALWNTLIAGYSLHGPSQMAFSLFERMQEDGCEPNNVSFVSVLKSCAGLAALGQGQHFFMHLVKSGVSSDLLVDSMLVDFFAKCGSLEDAAHVFTNMRDHDVVSYTAMITAYAQQGRANEAVSLYEQMKQEGVRPNEVTFLGVLNACSHAGLVQDAIQYFKSMTDVYGITPTASHCACVTDLLGRAGHHVEAMDLLQHLPADTDEVPLLALLGSCKSPYNVEVARYTADHALGLSSKNDAYYVFLSNISAE